jgi:pyruvate/2-oxoglutarate dehydrogenase complex dihydrolipoamide dehydrogenase (E3) component
VPKKVLVSTVERAWRARQASALGVTGTAGIDLDWPAVIARKDRLVASWTEGGDERLARQGIAVLRGRAAFTGPHELTVDGRRVTAERVVVATGSSPARPPIPGIEHALDSTGLLALTTRPARLVVVGGGAIGMELGFCFARAGTRVTVLQSGSAVLPAVDYEARQALLALAAEAGLTAVTGVKVQRIGADRTVEAEVGGATERFPADVVLVATGRPGNVAGLGLEAAGVAVERSAVKVDEFRQSITAPHVYAAGDVAGQHQHTPVAWYEGKLAAENALSKARKARKAVDYSVFPTTMFTIPALAQVGLTEAEADRRGLRATVHRAAYRDGTAAAVADETEGLMKVVAERGTGRLLGVHILGAEAEALIHVAAVAMRGGLGRADLAGMHYVFPTIAGALFDLMGD